MGDDKEMIPDLDQLDEILMMDAEELLDSLGEESLMNIISLSDEDLDDVEDLVGEEAFGIIKDIKSEMARNAAEKKKEKKYNAAKSKLVKVDPDNTELGKKLRAITDSYLKHIKDFPNTNEGTPAQTTARELYIKKHVEVLEKVKLRNREYANIWAYVDYRAKDNPDIIDSLMNEYRQKCESIERKYMSDINPDKVQSEMDNILQKHKRNEEQQYKYDRRRERSNPALDQRNAKYEQPAAESMMDTVVVTGAVGTIGYWLYKNLIAVKKERPAAGRHQNSYYYILTNDFKKSEKNLNTLLKGKKRFVVSKTVLEEIVGFRKKYYNCVAMCANRFMESYEALKSYIGKEDAYTFSDVNPIRDKALINRLVQASKPLNEFKHGNFYQAAIPVLSYEPNYDDDQNMNKIVIDSNYLESLLNPKETFEIIRELDAIIAKIPPVESATKYEDLIIKSSDVAGPLNCYIGIMYDLRELAEKTLGIVNAYVYTVYSILDYCVIANDKNMGITKDEEAFEGFIKDLKVAGIINANKIPEPRRTDTALKAKEKEEDEYKAKMKQASEDIKRIGGNMLLKSKIAVLERLYKEYESARKKNGYSVHPTVLKDTARSIFLSGKHETVNQLIQNKKPTESLMDNMLYRDIGILIAQIDELCRVDCGNEAASAAIAEATYLRSLINNCHADITMLNAKEANMLLHYFTMRYQVLSAFIVFSAAELHPEKFN